MIWIKTCRTIIALNSSKKKLMKTLTLKIFPILILYNKNSFRNSKNNKYNQKMTQIKYLRNSRNNKM